MAQKLPWSHFTASGVWFILFGIEKCEVCSEPVLAPGSASTSSTAAILRGLGLKEMWTKPQAHACVNGCPAEVGREGTNLPSWVSSNTRAVRECVVSGKSGLCRPKRTHHHRGLSTRTPNRTLHHSCCCPRGHVGPEAMLLDPREQRTQELRGFNG